MANNILREFLVAVGFKVDEAGYKRQSETVARVGKQLEEMDRQDRVRAEGEKKRTEERKANYRGLALGLAGVAAAATAAAAVVATATAKMVGGFDQFYFISQRTGASVNNIKSLGHAFGMVGSSAESAIQAIQSFAQARRTTPGLEGMLKSYGVDTRGDTADVLMRSIDAIQKRHPHYTGAQVANLFGITEEQYLTLTKYRKEIAAYREEYAKTQRALGVNSDETSRASASIAKSIASLTAVLGILSEKMFMTLAPVIERVVKGFRDWIEANPGKVESILQGIAHAAEAFGQALIEAGEWLADEKNQQMLVDFWKTYAAYIGGAVKELRLLLEMLLKLGKMLGLDAGGGNAIGIGVSKLLGLTSAEGGSAGLGIGAIGNAGHVIESDGGEPAGGESKPGLLRRGWNKAKRTFGGGGSPAGGKAGPLGPPPAGLLDNIARAEGTYRTGYNTSLAHGRFLPGGREHDLQNKTLSEVLALGKYMRRQPGNPNSSALGRYQIVGTTLREAAKALGMNLDSTKFDAATQDKMAHWIARKQGLGAWEGFKGHPRERAAAAAALARRDMSGGTGPASPSSSRTRASNFNPGGFNVEDYLKTRPMGASSTGNDNSRTVTQNSPVTVNVQGANDPAATGTAVGRAVGQANDMSLRNVQTAIR